MNLFQVFGTIQEPAFLKNFGGVSEGGLGKFLNLILNILVVAGSIWALINLVLAGYSFMSAGDDPKKVAGAWAKIWQTMLGLTVIAGSFVLAAIFGYLIFGNARAILQPSIPIP